MLSTPHDHERRVARQRLALEAPVTELAIAFRESSEPLGRQILADILGERGDERAVPALLEGLSDPLPGVRSSVADALAKVGSPASGKAILSRFRVEKDLGAKQMLAVALGATGCKLSIPLLIEALTSESTMLRSTAAWSLGKLEAGEAREALEQSLSHEPDWYVAERMREAISAITRSSSETQ